MTAYLVDTQIFLWWLNGDKRLKQSAKEILTNPSNKIYISVVSAWKISMKHAIGKLPLKTTLEEMVSLSKFEALSLRLEHIYALKKLQRKHKDPFDRMLIAQAMVENLTLMTTDKEILKYKIPLVKV